MGGFASGAARGAVRRANDTTRANIDSRRMEVVRVASAAQRRMRATTFSDAFARRPIEPNGPGQSMTITVSPAPSRPSRPGDRLVIDGHVASVQRSTLSTGQDPSQSAACVVFFAGDLVISADIIGISDDVWLRILESIKPVSDAQWAELVSAVEKPKADAPQPTRW